MLLSGAIVINMTCSYNSLHKEPYINIYYRISGRETETIGFVMCFDIGSVLSYHWLTCAKHVRLSH
ncbi:hypothetical protein J2X13_000316 [Aminobacter aminovorans]|nr:hypothetical protein [Aminobacter aminovorans]